MWLTAEARGIGMQVISVFSDQHVEDGLRRILSIPQYMKIAFACRLGYHPSRPAAKGIPGGYGGGPGVLVSVRVDDGDGAGCVEEQCLADGAEHHSVNAATTAAAHSEQLRVLSGIKESGAR